MSAYTLPPSFASLRKSPSSQTASRRSIGGAALLNRPDYCRTFQPAFTSSWANAGVAPCYGGGHPCFTIKDDKGGIVSTHVAPELNVRNLAVAEPGKAEAMALESELTIAMDFREEFGGKPELFTTAASPGLYHLYVSVGQPDGTPVLRLPYDDDDGHKRYKIGQIEVSDRNV